MRIFISILSIFVLFACKNDPKKAVSAAAPSEANPFATVSGNPLPQDFVDFFQKFHTDSVFQMERIQWPMQGEETVQVDSMRTKIPKTWTTENWAIHHLPDFQDGMFERKFSMLGEEMVIEVVFNKNIGLRQERRFAKVAGDDWAMIYYSEM